MDERTPNLPPGMCVHPSNLTDDQLLELSKELHEELDSRDMLASDVDALDNALDNALLTLEMACDPDPPADQYPRTPQQVEVARFIIENRDAIREVQQMLDESNEEDEDA